MIYILILYFICTVFFGAGTLASALPICLFTFEGIKSFIDAPHISDSAPDTPTLRKKRTAEKYFKAFSYISAGFIISEVFSFAASRLAGKTSFYECSKALVLPIPLYITAMAVCAAACAHIESLGEKRQKLVCALAPMTIVVISAILVRAGEM